MTYCGRISVPRNTALAMNTSVKAPHRTRLLVSMMMALAGPAVSAQNCVRWVPRTDVGSPGPRYGHSLTYDAARGVTILFGGEYTQRAGDDPIFLNDVWEYDGALWKKIEVKVPIGRNPALPRGYATLVPYQTTGTAGVIQNRFRLGSGIGFHTPTGNLTITYGWDDFQFEQDGTGMWLEDYTPGPAPQARGSLGIGGVVGDSCTSWKVASSGIARDADALFDHRTVQVYRNGELITLALGGGRSYTCIDPLDNPTETFPGPMVEFASIAGKWQEISSGIRPFNRFQHVAAYDSHRERVVVYGGFATSDPDMHWELKIPKEGPAGFPAPDITWERVNLPVMPPERAFAGMVYDEKRRVMVMVGGVGRARYGDTWELVSSPPQITGQTNHETCIGTPVTFYPTISGSGELRSQWYSFEPAFGAEVGGSWNRMEGQTNLQLVVNPTIAQSYTYRLEVRDPCNNLSQLDFHLTVHDKPYIFLVDQRIESCPGAFETMSARVKSTLPMTVQWHKDGRPFGASRELPADSEYQLVELEFSRMSTNDTGIYSIEARNACGVSTNPQSLMIAETTGAEHINGKVQIGPAIEVQPAGRSIPVCARSFLPLASVRADGAYFLSYRWRLDGKFLTNGADYAGVDTRDLQLRTPALYKHEGEYDVVVTDLCGQSLAITSQVAKITITPGPEWRFRTTNGPSARYSHSMVYDSARAVSVLFGGFFQSAGAGNAFNDLWEWNGERWTRLMGDDSSAGWTLLDTGYWRPTYSDRPVARGEHMMTYDARRQRVVLFGGTAVDPGRGVQFLNDTWEWDGERWHFRGTNGPGWRVNAGFAYHPIRETSVLFGGSYSSGDAFPGALWEWDGAAWKISPTVGNFAPNATTATLAYDNYHDVMFYGPTPGFSGIVYDVFWSLKWPNWSATTGGFNINEAGTPYSDMVYDSYRRRMVNTFGVNGGTGFWNGREWTVLSRQPAPRARFWHASTYDAARKRVALFGGTFGNYNSFFSSTNDTWELIALDSVLINSQPASQYRPANETATFTVVAEAPEGLPLRYQWFRDKILLRDQGHISGATNATLTVAAVQPADGGVYTASVSCNCGTVTTAPAILTLKPELQIFSAENTMTLIWSDPAVILETADEPTGPWTAAAGATSPFSPGSLAGAKFFRLRQTAN